MNPEKTPEWIVEMTGRLIFELSFLKGKAEAGKVNADLRPRDPDDRWKTYGRKERELFYKDARALLAGEVTPEELADRMAAKPPVRGEIEAGLLRLDVVNEAEAVLATAALLMRLRMDAVRTGVEQRGRGKAAVVEGSDEGDRQELRQDGTVGLSPSGRGGRAR